MEIFFVSLQKTLSTFIMYTIFDLHSENLKITKSKYFRSIFNMRGTVANPFIKKDGL